MTRVAAQTMKKASPTTEVTMREFRVAPAKILRRVARTRLTEVAFTWDAAMEAGCLHDANGDPVDRGLLGVAIAGGLTLVTRDDDLLDGAKRKGVRALDTRP